MEKNDAYLYGMILITNSFLLKDNYPKADTYGEIKAKYVLPGGETGTSATVLSSLGCSVIMDGPYLGNNTYEKIVDFYKDKSVDVSRMFLDKTYDGLEDYVLIDKNTRTPFGTFADFYSNGLKRWNEPLEADILNSKVVGLDPWFEDQSLKVAALCQENNIPYITIDCPYDSELHRNCTINILSNEFLLGNYPDIDRNELFKKYVENTNGLVIFTLGSKDILYGRKGQPGLPKHFTPYIVDVVSTLGAGDTFKAGCIYGVIQNFEDDRIVQFAAATAACACAAFPLPLNPPSLTKVNAIISGRQ